MASFVYDPFHELDRLFNDAFDTYFPGPRRIRGEAESPAIRQFRPRMDLHEDVKNNCVTALFELPGMTKENLNIDIHNNRLTISGEIKSDKEYEESGYAVRERRCGKFSRMLQLPVGVKEEEVKAKVEHGVLTITFPKTTPEMTPKKIAVE
ncbi:hypothetical protein AX17_006622 [Amanita inopinata Kibby_2008]|nr:hypothetical protein AX17_006622 [Amanita inopinata Kibby_2008]